MTLSVSLRELVLSGAPAPAPNNLPTTSRHVSSGLQKAASTTLPAVLSDAEEIFERSGVNLTQVVSQYRYTNFALSPVSTQSVAVFSIHSLEP